MRNCYLINNENIAKDKLFIEKKEENNCNKFNNSKRIIDILVKNKTFIINKPIVKNNLIYTDSLLKYYKLLEKISEDQCSKIYLAKHKQKKYIRYAKFINIENFDTTAKEEIIQYYTYISNINHPNILKVYELFKLELHYVIIFQFFKSKPLYEYFIEKKEVTEYDVSYVLANITYIINYLHNNNFIIRNINFNTFYYNYEDDVPVIKLVNIFDFLIDGKNVSLHKYIEIKYDVNFMSPESISNNNLYTFKSDIWGLGVMLYTIVFNALPFEGVNITENINNCNYNFEYNNIYCYVDINCKYLIRRMLQKYEKDRISIAKIIENQFLELYKNKYTAKEADNVITFNDLKNYSNQAYLKKVLLNYIAINNFLKDEDKYITVFKDIDTDKDGKLSEDEIFNCLTKVFSISNNENNDYKETVKLIISKIDINNSGEIDYSEFISILLDKYKCLKSSHLISIFKSLDKNNDGYLDKDEIRNLFENIDEIDLEGMFKNIDKNNDNKISVEEFTNILNKIN